MSNRTIKDFLIDPRVNRDWVAEKRKRGELYLRKVTRPHPVTLELVECIDVANWTIEGTPGSEFKTLQPLLLRVQNIVFEHTLPHRIMYLENVLQTGYIETLHLNLMQHGYRIDRNARSYGAPCLWKDIPSVEDLHEAGVKTMFRSAA